MFASRAVNVLSRLKFTRYSFFKCYERTHIGTTTFRYIKRNFSNYDVSKIRNIAIIAHVDHGKTTLVDKLLLHAGAVSMNDSDARVMDSNVIEKERGITIMSKATSVEYNGYLINIVDTPGHSDFGGEVERVLSMVDGVCLLVCATEGPMPQTKYVLQKALKSNLKPIVVINKVDRNTSRISEVENDLLDMFLNFHASEDQLEYPTIYTSAKKGWAVLNIEDEKKDMSPLFDAILKNIPPPKGKQTTPFSMLITQTDENQFLGKACLGVVNSGVLEQNGEVKLINHRNGQKKIHTVSKITRRRGLENVELKTCSAGEIVYVYGVNTANINDTICNITVTEPLKYPSIDPPTLSVMISTNGSPLAGKDGKHFTINAIGERLTREALNNVSITVIPSEESFELRARGEIQIAVLLETMRREGYEMSVSSPKVLFKTETVDGKTVQLEPIEEVTLELDSVSTGLIMEKLERRKGKLITYNEMEERSKLVFHIPTRGFIGLISELKSQLHNTINVTYNLNSYEPYKGPLDLPPKGFIVATHSGVVTSFALQGLDNKNILFTKPGDEIYMGTIIGLNSKNQELEFNPTKTRVLTNVRASSREEYVKIPQYKEMPLEAYLILLTEDEILEITPNSLRMRKLILDPKERRLYNRKKKSIQQ